MMELYINNQRVDIDGNVIKQSFQNNNLGEVKDRQSNFTNKFKVPKTPKNRLIFDMLSVVGNVSRKQYKNLPCRLVDNGIEIVSDGFCYVKNSNALDYDVVIYSGIASLFEFINNKSILDLNYNSYNHLNAPFHIFNSFSNSSGYIYAAGAFVNSDKIPSDESLLLGSANSWLPSFFEQTIFEMIFQEAGFTFSGVPFQKFVVAPAKGIEQDFVGNTNQLVDDEISFRTSYDVNSPRNTTQSAYSKVLARFTAPDTGNYNLLLEGTDLTNADWKTTPSSNIGVPSCETTIHISVDNDHQEIRLVRTNISNTDFDIDYSFTAPSGSEIIIYHRTYIGTSSSNGFIDVDINFNFEFSVGYSLNRLFIDFTQILPDIKQNDFVKEVMWRYGLSLKKERNSNHYEFKRIDDIILNTADADDWSKKFDVMVSETYKLGDYAQRNIFTYSDKINQGFIDIDNDLLKNETTLITSNYQSHIQSDFAYQGLILQSHEIYDVFYPEGASANASGFSSIEIGAKIYSLNYQNGSITIGRFRSPGTDQNFIGNIPCLSFDGLDYQTQINQNYTGFKQVIENALILKAKILLGTIDIYNLDFFKLKYLKQYGSYFYLNKISNYDKSNITDCEFIKIPANISTYGYGNGNRMIGNI